jgi:hypothetical protein
MSDAYTGIGTLSDQKTVILDEPTHLPPGRVRVIVEPLPDEHSDRTWMETLRAIRESLRVSGYRARTRQEIDEQIRAERNAWDG